MPTYRDTAVVLGSHKFGEADRVVILLTESHGKVRAVARGVRKTRSSIGARLETLSHVDISLRTGRGLDTVAEVRLLDTVSGLRGDLSRLQQGLAMVEAIDKMTPDREPAPQLYRMVVGALRTIAERGGPLVVPAFYWKLLAADGLRPELDMCVRCGEDAQLVAFDMDQGGALCRNCRTGAPLSEEALATMRMILGGRLNEALEMPASRTTHEVMAHATRALEHHIERRLRTVAMFETH